MSFCRLDKIGLAFLTLACLMAGPDLAAQEVLPTEGTDTLRKEYDAYRSLQPKLFKGEIAYSKADEERYNKVIDFEARWTLYRFTWGENQIEPGKIDRLHKEFENDLYNLLKNRPVAEFVLTEFAKQIAVRSKEVLQTTRPIARLNAARVLQRMAATGAAPNEMVDTLVGALTDPNERNEGVKLYLLRGLRDVLSVPQPKPPVLTHDRIERAIKALVDFVERKAEFTAAAPTEEKEGFRSLRREGFRALAWARYPSLGDKAKPGLVLLRASVRDGFIPETRTDEQVEAALGVTRLRPELDPSYQKDYAAFILAHFVVDLGNAYQTRNERPTEQRPYKLYASKITEGLESMKGDTKNKPADDYVRAVVAECAKVLNKMEADAAAAPFDLSTWLEKNPSPNKQLYLGTADSTVKPASKRDPAETATGG